MPQRQYSNPSASCARTKKYNEKIIIRVGVARCSIVRYDMASTDRVGGPIGGADRESELESRVSSSFLDVVATDGDAVVLRHVVRGMSHNVAHNPHGGRRRVDKRVANHELLQNVVLEDKEGQAFRKRKRKKINM